MNIFGIDQMPEEQPSDLFGVGTEEATAEEQEALDNVMVGIERAIHGEASADFAKSLKMAPDLASGVSMLAAPLVQSADSDLEAQGISVPDEIWFGQNGAIQQTVELLWEMAEAMNIAGSDDPAQLEAAYINTLQIVGQALYENDPDSVAEAQQAMMEAEMGADVMASLEEQAMAAQAGPEAMLGMGGEAMAGIPAEIPNVA